MLDRLAETLESQDRAATAASFARVLIACGRVDQARPFALDGNDPVLVARLLLEVHDFAHARRLLDEARQRDPFDPRVASARGRLAFLEKRFGEAVWDLLEAALLRPDGLPDATDRRFLRAARALAPAEIPGLEGGGGRGARPPGAGGPAPLSGGRLAGSLGGAAALADPARGHRVGGRARPGAPALRAARAPGTGRARALLGRVRRRAAPARDRQRPLQDRRPGRRDLRRGPGRHRARAPRRRSASSRWARRGPETSSARRRSSPSPRVCDARARGAVTLLGFPPDFFAPEPDRAVWLRYLRTRLARRLSALNDLFRGFFPDEGAPPEAAAGGPGGRPLLRLDVARGEVALADDGRPLRVGPLPLRGLRRGEAVSGGPSSSARETRATRST